MVIIQPRRDFCRSQQNSRAGSVLLDKLKSGYPLDSRDALIAH